MFRQLLMIGMLMVAFGAQAAQNRTALVIGNSEYTDAPLKNPANDARDMAATLKKLGFEVIERINANQQEMEAAIDTFGRKLEAKKGVGLLFYAGHGIQSKGQNYLIPVDVVIDRETDLRYKAVNASKILDEMGYANNGLNIAILDACRNNPLTRSFRNSARGLARISNAPKGLFLAYSTDPGNVAMDGKGRNSPFTGELLKVMTKKGLPIEQVFKEVRRNVETQSRGKQTPFTTSSLSGDFYFVEAAAPASKAVQVAGGTVDQSQAMPGVATGTFDITSNPPAVNIRLNGGHVGATPVTIPHLASGNYRIEAEKAGYRGEHKQVFLIAGQKRTINFILDPLSQSEQTYPFTVEVTPPDARVRIMNINPRYQDGMQLPEGEYDVLVDAQGHHSWRGMVIHAGRATNHVVTLEAGAPKKTSRRDPNVDRGVKLVRIPGGCFQMGSPSDEKNRGHDENSHEVCVDSFRLAAQEVSVGQFRRFVDASGYQTDAEKGSTRKAGCRSLVKGRWKRVKKNNWSTPGYAQDDNHPVTCVSWNDAVAYAAWLAQQTGKPYRLPTEAEWEYAARAGSKTIWHWGDNPDPACRYANVADAGKKDGVDWKGNFKCDDGYNLGTAPVGSFDPNDLGLHDMMGNVWEWTCSGYSSRFEGLEKECKAAGDPGNRTYRGGSWQNVSDRLRSASRNWNGANSRNSTLGFRLALPAE